VAGRHGGTNRLRVHEPEDGQMLGQGSRPGQCRLEDDVGDPGGDAQGKESVQGCPARLSWNSGHDSRDAEPELPLGGRC